MSVEMFDPLGGWPEPDPRFLNGGVRRAPVFPLETLGSLATYVGELAAAKGGPPDYLAISLLSAAAGVIGAARSVQVRHGWIEPCAVWGLLVGKPSSGKTQPLDVIRCAVREIEPDDAPDFAERYSAWKTAAAIAEEMESRWRLDLKNSVKDNRPAPARPSDADAPAEPLRPRILIGSVTVEKLEPMFAAFPRGLLMLMDEGAAWFGNFGKYGGDGDAAYFLSAFNGIPVQIDRVKEGRSVAPDRALLSVCAGIQPDRLAELLLNARADDGLVSRFLPVWPDPVPPVWQTTQVDERRVEGLLRRLRSLSPGAGLAGRLAPVVLPLSDDAASLFAEWWPEAVTGARDASGMMAGFLGKAPGVAARLALVIELLGWAADGGAEPTTVSARSVAAALTLCADYFTPMAERVLGDAARPPSERAAAVLLKAIQAYQARSLNRREVYRKWRVPGLSSAADVDAALRALEESDCVRAAPATGERGGRPTGDYLVNPRVLAWPP